jgi:hypothetical protein
MATSLPAATCFVRGDAYGVTLELAAQPIAGYCLEARLQFAPFMAISPPLL